MCMSNPPSFSFRHIMMSSLTSSPSITLTSKTIRACFPDPSTYGSAVSHRCLIALADNLKKPAPSPSTFMSPVFVSTSAGFFTLLHTYSSRSSDFLRYVPPTTSTLYRRSVLTHEGSQSISPSMKIRSSKSFRAARATRSLRDRWTRAS